jgi:predicted dehydrogenase
MTEKMKVVIVGYGYMGEIRRKVVEALPDLELVGICDKHLTAERINFTCPHFIKYTEAIEELKPDIVFVCTPNQFSPDLCVYSLEHGCHVFCEKPPGRTLQDIERIAAAEQAHPGLKVMFGFNHRHHPAILEAKSMVEARRMGEILWLRGIYGKSGGAGRDFEKSWRNDPAVAGGGILLDQGIHMLDLFRFFCGDFTEVFGLLSTCYWNISVEDNAFVVLRSATGKTAQLHSSATLWKHTFHLEIGLEKGYLIAQGLLSKSGSYGRETLTIGRKSPDGRAAVGNPREEVVYFDTDLSWELQVKELVNCILNDVPVSDSSTLDALRVMEIIDAVYRQEEEGWRGTALLTGEGGRS